MMEPISTTRLIGHEDIQKFFKNSFENNNLHNAYIFAGKYGIGKETAAIHFARMIMSGKDLKNQAEISKRMQNGTLENFMYLKKEDSILVEDTRVVTNFLTKKTIGRKCVVIDAVENMTVQAANSLLKVIEEAKNVTFFLVTSFLDRVLSTIKSRAIIVNFKELNIQEVEEVLSQTDYHVDRGILDICSDSPGIVLKISTLEKEHGFFSVLLENFSSKSYRITQVLKENVRIVIEVLLAIFENVLLSNKKVVGVDFRDVFVNDVERILGSYEEIMKMYKNFQLYNLDKDGFLNFVFQVIDKIKK